MGNRCLAKPTPSGVGGSLGTHSSTAVVAFA